MQAEEHWDNFVALLNALSKNPQVNLLGSIAVYKKLFLQANKETKDG